MFIKKEEPKYAKLLKNYHMAHGTFIKGSIFKIIGHSARGYDVEDMDSGERISELGLHFDAYFKVVDESSIVKLTIKNNGPVHFRHISEKLISTVYLEDGICLETYEWDKDDGVVLVQYTKINGHNSYIDKAGYIVIGNNGNRIGYEYTEYDEEIFKLILEQYKNGKLTNTVIPK